VLRGRGRFKKRSVVEGSLEISTWDTTDDGRLRRWIGESHLVLPRLQAMVRNGDGGPEPWHVVVEDLRRRVADLEEELAQLRRDLAGA
jgi:hypothetical protein